MKTFKMVHIKIIFKKKERKVIHSGCTKVVACPRPMPFHSDNTISQIINLIWILPYPPCQLSF